MSATRRPAHGAHGRDGSPDRLDERFADEAGYVDDGYHDDGYHDDGYVDDRWADDRYDDVDEPILGRRRRTQRRRRRVAGTLAALVALTAAVLVGVGLHLKGEISPGGTPGHLVEVTIPAGSSDATIGADLAAAHVITGPSLFRWYVKVRHDGPFLPGTYTLATDESYSAAIAALKKGPPVTVDHLVVPEGFTLAQIAQRVAALPGMHLSAATFLADATNGTVTSTFSPPGNPNLEGLVFPATYDIARTMTEVDVLRLMVQKFQDKANALNISAQAAALGVTPYQVVTVASIVEREAKLDPDRPNVASTIYNRLRVGMTLGADSTLVYALRLSNPGLDPAKVNFETPSPYNTRLHKGLPPTPIAEPGLPSLAAAINPPTTKDLYFVEVQPDGQLGFATSVSGFDQLQAQCRAVHLC